MVQSEFEKIMFERTNKISDDLAETRIDVADLKRLVSDHIDFKVKAAADKQALLDNKFKVISTITGILAGASIVWQIVRGQ